MFWNSVILRTVHTQYAYVDASLSFCSRDRCRETNVFRGPVAAPLPRGAGCPRFPVWIWWPTPASLPLLPRRRRVWMSCASPVRKRRERRSRRGRTGRVSRRSGNGRAPAAWRRWRSGARNRSRRAGGGKGCARCPCGREKGGDFTLYHISAIYSNSNLKLGLQNCMNFVCQTTNC